MQSLIETLKCFNSDLISPGKSELSTRMSFYQGKLIEFNRDFHKITLNGDEEAQSLLTELLTHLNIPVWQWGRYLGAPLTVYELLMELRQHAQAENKAINEFIARIEAHEKSIWTKIFIGSALLMGIAEAIYPFLYLVGEVCVTLFAPIMGLVYTAGSSLYSLYENISNDKMSFLERARANVFLVFSSALNFARYGLLITAAAIGTPLVAILSIANAVVGVVHELFALTQTLISKQTQIADDTLITLDALQAEARHQLNHVQRVHTVIINVAAAVAFAGVIIGWCLIPGTFFVTVGAVIALGLVSLGKSALIKFDEKRMRVRLQETFEEIELEYKKDLVPTNGKELITDSVVEAAARKSLSFSLDMGEAPSLPSRDGLFAHKKRLSATDILTPDSESTALLSF